MDEDRNETKKSYMFNGKDFNNWKFRMEVLLREHDAESFISKSLEEHEEIIPSHLDDQAATTRKEKLKEELRKKERKCYSLIVQRIGNDFLEYIKDKKNPKEAWTSLCGTFERKGVSNRMFLRRELLSLKLKENGDLVAHLLKFEKTLRNLKAVGAKMEEEDIVCQLLLSLPESYESVATALETMKAEELTLEFVKGRLLDCDTKRKTSTIGSECSGISEYPTAMMSRNKKHIQCFICGKSGHFQNNCPENRRFGNNCSNCKNCCRNQYQSHHAEIQDEDDEGKTSL